MANPSFINTTVRSLGIARSMATLSLSICAQSAQPIKALSSDAPAEVDYQRWVDRDVRWIISPEERATFRSLSRNEDRDRFIEQFWLQRDPNPDTPQNEYKKEHYRRIAYANVHFATEIPARASTEIPGWLTDRGRIYIMYGQPDGISTISSDSSLEKPFTIWHYRSIPDYGRNINLKFIDVCSCGDYRLETSRRTDIP